MADTTTSTTTGSATTDAVKTGAITTSTMTNQQSGTMMGVDLERTKKIANASSIGGTIGMIGGLVYAFKTKKKFWGYVGFGLLGSIGGSLITNVAVRPFIKKTK
jgi:hypothetical protein